MTQAMTEPVAQNPVANPRLVRPYDSTWMGVATALARTTGTDVVLWRVLFVVLTLFGGLGLGLYLLGVVAIPAEGVDRSLAERLVHGPDRRLSKGEVFLLAVVTVMTAGVIHGGDVLLPALYPNTFESAEEELKLGRATDWVGADGEVPRGAGGRQFRAGDTFVSLADVRALTFGAD